MSSVPLPEVPYVWSSQIEMIERAMSKGQADWGTPQDILRRVLSGKSHLWVIHRGQEILGVVVFCVRANDLMTKMIIEVLAGQDLELWIDQQQILLDFAEIVGVDCIEASCRPGLAKFLKGHGWKQKAIIMELT